MQRMTPSEAASHALKQRPSKLLDVLIVGGGLSGLMVAYELQRVAPFPLSWRLLESRPVLGGRLANDDKGNQIDLGGAWIWPLHQPHMKKLTASLSILTFLQPDDPSSTRIVGGAVQYIHRLAEKLPNENIYLNTIVTSCTLQSDIDTIHTCESEGPLVCVRTASNETMLARRVVFAVPPRLISKHIHFEPPLSQEKQSAMASSHTWMAGVTKVALVYPRRFWDSNSSNMGFPSSRGPAFQVYDASTVDGKVSALTFFALATNTTDDTDKDLADQCASLMQDIWSHRRQPDLARQATGYSQYHVQRWPKETFISEDPNPTTVYPHPYPVPALSKSEWDGALLFAGSESDRVSPGVMEGAVGAALRVVQDLKTHFSTLIKKSK